MAGMTGPVIGFGLVSFLLQSVGYLAMLALLTDRARPTVARGHRQRGQSAADRDRGGAAVLCRILDGGH